MKHRKFFVSLVTVLIVLGTVIGFGSENGEITQSVYAQKARQPNQGSGDRRFRRPPQEAIAACAGKSEGAQAEMTTPRGDTVTGTCQKIQDQLVLVPEGGSPQSGGRSPQGQKPPQEAIKACEGKSEGDTAEMTTPRGDTITGTCQKIQDQLVLVPEGGPHKRPPLGR